MKRKDALYWMLVGIAALTIGSGLFQQVAAGFELHLLAVDDTPATRQLFATVGMFMVLFGGVFLHALCSPADHPIVILWGGLQKFGASAAVGLGVWHHVFSPLALLVAGFDFLSGILAIFYWRRMAVHPAGTSLETSIL